MDITFAGFSRFPQLHYGVSARKDGSMNRRLNRENRDRYLSSIGIDPSFLVTADLVHGASVAIADERAKGEYIQGVDALATAHPDLCLSVTGADCFPVFLYEPMRDVVAISHVGWRGLLEGIVQNTIATLNRDLHADLSKVLVGIGPGIRSCHFEISRDDSPRFSAYSSFVYEKEERVYVDIPAIILRQLIEAGLDARHIDDCEVCTFCHPEDFFSYRRDKPKDVESMICYIMRKKKTPHDGGE